MEYGSDVDKTQSSLDVLQRLKQRVHDLHPEVQTCCCYKVRLLPFIDCAPCTLLYSQCKDVQ